MFDRYTETARRVIFFARYEASQYGSSSIETEHLLLGLLRADPILIRRFLGAGSVAADISADLEKHIPRGERISTSVDMPLSQECDKVLKRAAEECERLAQRHIGTEHLLLGILRAEGSLASRFLRERGVKPEVIREQLANSGGSPRVKASPKPLKAAIATLDNFLDALKGSTWDQLSSFFAENAQFVDSTGKRWRGRDEIERQFEALFAPCAKKNVTFLLEGTNIGPAECVLASILWEKTIGSESTSSVQRMTIILAPEEKDWRIFLLQVTPVIWEGSGQKI